MGESRTAHSASRNDDCTRRTAQQKKNVERGEVHFGRLTPSLSFATSCSSLLSPPLNLTGRFFVRHDLSKVAVERQLNESRREKRIGQSRTRGWTGRRYEERASRGERAALATLRARQGGRTFRKRQVRATAYKRWQEGPCRGWIQKAFRRQWQADFTGATRRLLTEARPAATAMTTTARRTVRRTSPSRATITTTTTAKTCRGSWASLFFAMRIGRRMGGRWRET